MFAESSSQIGGQGYIARQGRIVTASMEGAPRQRNFGEENARVKEGGIAGEGLQGKRRPQDVEARWTRKHGGSSYGYKNHVSVGRE